MALMFGLKFRFRVIRPPRGLRDAPSSNYARQADFTVEVGVRYVVIPVTLYHLGGHPMLSTHYQAAL
jgi:hypothetical protein